MSDEEKPLYEQLPGEPDLWYGRFVKFMRMGTKRSVNAVFRRENKKQQETTMFPGPTWYEAAKEWHWEERARAYDAYVREEEERVIRDEREKVLRSGFALQHKRIAAYDRLLDKLIRETRKEERIWLPDVKSIQVGPDLFQRVNLVHFNTPLFTVIDRYLAAIAGEMGERVKKKDIVHHELPGNVYLNFDPDLDGSEP